MHFEKECPVISYARRPVSIGDWRQAPIDTDLKIWD
jgi:hypothetical protein